MSFLVNFPLPMMWFMCRLETVVIQNYDWEERTIPLPGTGGKSRKTCHWTIYNIWAFGGCVCITADLDMVVCLWLKWTIGINCWHLILLRILIFSFQATSKSKDMVMSRPHGMLVAVANHMEVLSSVVTAGYSQPSGSRNERWFTLIDDICPFLTYMQIHCIFSHSHIRIFPASSALPCLRLLGCEFSLR